MNNFKKIALQAALSTTLMLAGSAFAADAGTFYLGLGVDSTNSDYSSSKCNSDFGITDCSVSANSAGFKVLGGYNITPMFAVEGAYGSLGEVKISSQEAGGSLKQSTNVFNVDAVGNFGVGNGVTLSARLGAFSAQSDAKPDGGSSTTASSTGIDFGVSGSYDFTKNVIGRLEYQRFNGVSKDGNNDNNFKNNINVIGVSLVYNY